MSKELEVKKAVIDSKTIENFLFTSGTKLNEKQEAMFLQLALRNQLDPFKREIYAIPYGNDFNIVTGYQVYIQRAETTNRLNGWHCEAMRNEKNELIGAKIVIYRKDFEHPFEWEVTLKEFDKGQSSWKKMPEFMIKKVCIGQGFRLAFPNELGGLPYLQEELEELTPAGESNPESNGEPKGESKQGSLPKQVIKEPIQKPQIKEPNDPAIESQIIAIRKLLRSLNWKEEEYKKTIGHPHFHELTQEQAANLIKDLQEMKKTEVPNG
jgi:phage recombination protein Bet